jgi:uncharacterized metal-binding protein YceD (DUF177 family)
VKIFLADYNESPKKLLGEDPVECFEWEVSSYDLLTPAGPILSKLTIQLFDKELLVMGECSADFVGNCCRCGKEISMKIVAEVNFSEEISLETGEFDLTNELRECILLALPNHPLCSVDCKGLCSQCGKPLSEGKCSCKKNDKTSVWDALDGIL